MATPTPTTSAITTKATFNISSINDAFFGDSLGAPDLIVVILYFIGVLAVGLWSMYNTNRSTIGGYFLAGRSIIWWPIGASLFSSNVGSGHFIGLAGAGAASGIAVGTFEWNAMFVILLLAWVFLPVYIASGVVTMPEYLKKRFGGKRLQICMASLYLFIYIFTKIAVDLYAGAIFIHEALKWDLYPSVIALLVITGFYTIGGGLAAVIYTDTLQTIIMLIGAIALMIVAFVNIGGYYGLVSSYMTAVPLHRLPNHPECGVPRNDSFHVFRAPTDEDFPWTGVVFGMPLLSIWYWCTDQVIVQRTLAAKNLTHAKGGALLCSYLKILPMFLMVMVGMISRAKFPDQVGCVVPEICSRVCGNPSSCADIAYPKLVMEMLPTGARGLMLSVVLSALMSSLTSIFNSSSTLLTIDLWSRARPKASERELMIVGRVFIIFLVILSVVWIPVIQSQEDGQLFTYIQKISSFFQPPIAACFILAVFWKRTNEQGAFWGVLVGMIIGLSRMIAEFAYPPPPCGKIDNRPSIISDLHYLHFAIVLAIVSALVTVFVSLCSPAKPDSEYGGLTWWTRFDTFKPMETPLKKKKSKKKTEKTKLVDEDFIGKQFTEDCANGNTNDNDLGNPSIVPRFPMHVESVTYNGQGIQVNSVESASSPSEQNEAQENAEPQLDGPQKPLWHKLFSFIVGMDKHKITVGSESPIRSLDEDPFWSKVENYSMIVCVIIAALLYIIFR